MKLQNVKWSQFSFISTLKLTIVSVAILVIAAIALFTPWYLVTLFQPVTKTFSQTVTQTSSFTIQLASTSQGTRTVYAQPDTITIQGTLNAALCVTAPSVAPQAGPNCGAWTSTSFRLEKGSSILVNCECSGVIGIYAIFPPYKYVDFTFNGQPPTNRSEAIVPVTGLYEVAIWNFKTTSVIEIGITVIEQTVLVTSSAETSYYTGYNTVFNTVETRVASLAQVSPYSVIGVLPSIALLALLCFLIAFVVLLDVGVISVSTRKRRRR